MGISATAPAHVPPGQVRAVIQILADTYHGRMSIELEDPFRILVATVISQRTREEQTEVVAERVFRRYPDARALAQADQQELYELLKGSTYRDTKAPRLIALARGLVERFGGRVPSDLDSLLSLPGVGRKTANCTLIYAFGIAALCVDTHMHRTSNRLGWTDTASPDQTERALEKVIPKDLWLTSNRLFVQHGRAVCVPGIPFCLQCNIRAWCKYGLDANTPKR